MGKYEANKPLLLTFDYELFFGADSGTAQRCLIEPVNSLLDVLDSAAVKATFFIDVLYLWALKNNFNSSQNCREDYELVEDQIKQIIARGHDAQLHIHSHWLDAEIDLKRNKWVFTYKKYRLHALNNTADSSDILSVSGCVEEGKKILQDICRCSKSDYEVFCFRAGGWCLQPFEDLRAALINNGVTCDSSVLPGYKSSNDDAHYMNYLDAPQLTRWVFDKDVCEVNKQGSFVEVPIPTVKVKNWRLLRNFLVKRILGGWSKYGDGVGMRFQSPSFNRLKMLVKPFSTQLKYIDLDAYILSDMKYMIDEIDREYEGEGAIVLLGHPKNSSKSSIDTLNRLIHTTGYKFAKSYRDFL